MNTERAQPDADIILKNREGKILLYFYSNKYVRNPPYKITL